MDCSPLKIFIHSNSSALFPKNIIILKSCLGDPSKMSTILIVEDEEDISKLVEYHLNLSGFSITCVSSGSSALAQIKRSRPSLIILDLMLPDMDGKDICRALKSNPETRSIPIVMLTAKSEEIDRVIGFELGAEDYITKPFSPKELVLRVKAILRRIIRVQENEKIIQIEGLLINVERHLVSVNNTPIDLTRTEFKLLYELASHRGRVFTREILLDRVWGYTYEGYARTVDTHIKRLREKLGPMKEYIETIRGIGYRFKEESEIF